MPTVYTGYGETHIAGYSGSRADIQYIRPAQVSDAVSVWVGMNEPALVSWVQVGWTYEARPGVHISKYAEVHQYTGANHTYFIDGIPGRAVYKVEQVLVGGVLNARWTVDATMIHQEPWAGIVGPLGGAGTMTAHNTVVECWNDQRDYVPGSSNNKCFFRDVQVQPVGGAYQNATLATRALPADPNGIVAKNTGTGTTWMSVYDRRNASLERPHSRA